MNFVSAMKGLFLFFLSVLCTSALSAVPEFVVMAPPHSGNHLIVPLLEELTGKEGVWPRAFFEPYDECDEATFHFFASDPNYLAVLWNKKPIAQRRVKEAMDTLKRKGRFMFLNTPYTERMESFLDNRQTVVFTLDRDPRDTAITALFHIDKFGTGLIEAPWFRRLEFSEQLSLIILGSEWHNSICYIARAFEGWKHSSVAVTISFERLMGPWGGGGTEQEQIAELRKIADALGRALSDQKLIEIFKKVYASGYTFHKGKVGMWKDYFDREHIELYDQKMKEWSLEVDGI